MNRVRITSILFLLCAGLLIMPLAIDLGARQNQSSKRSAFGKMNEDIYIQVTGRMIYYDRVYRKKYQINNTNPNANRTVEGVSNAYKYEKSMNQQRKAVLSKYGVSSEEFEGYTELLDASSSTPDGKKKRQRLFDRAAQIAAGLANK